MSVDFSRRAFLMAPAALRAAPGRTNVLFIAVDDLRPDFSAYGNRKVISPNLERLARSGLTFERAYCQQAVCSPSRTSLLTGRRPDTTRVYELQTHFRKNLPDVVTLPQHFRNSGFTTAGLSKIFHGGLEDPASWSIPHWIPRGPDWNTEENARRNERVWRRLQENGLMTPPAQIPRQERGPAWVSAEGPDNAQPDGLTADTAVAALETLRNDRFFLAVGFLKPHLPFVAPSKYFDLYGNTTFEPAKNPSPPRNAPRYALHNSGELRAYSDIPETGPIPPEKQMELIRAYYAATSFMDAQLGRVLDAVEKMGLAKNTVVILWGDHGYHLGDHGLWNKHTNFENATHSPLMIRVPGMKTAGQRTRALTEFVDIYPSLCEICGVSTPEGLEGTSFAPLLDKPNRPWKTAAFSQYPRAQGVMGYTMRTDAWRYTEWRSREGEVLARELYDHAHDPAEDVNLAEAAGHKSTVERLAAQLRAGWLKARPA